MNIRKAETTDLDQIEDILKEAKEGLRTLGIDQWQYGYPDREVFAKDIELERAYVLQEGSRILAACTMIVPLEPSYADIDGRWCTDGDYVTVHRIMVHKDHKGKGYGALLLEEAERVSAAHGFRSVRIDTHPGNQPMQHLLKRAGFVYCGIIHLQGGAEDGHIRLAYERLNHDES